MKSFAAFLQIRELFDGDFNWQGVLLLALFGIMGLIAVGFPVFIGYKTFQSKSKTKKKDDI